MAGCGNPNCANIGTEKFGGEYWCPDHNPEKVRVETEPSILGQESDGSGTLVVWFRASEVKPKCYKCDNLVECLVSLSGKREDLRAVCRTHFQEYVSNGKVLEASPPISESSPPVAKESPAPTKANDSLAKWM